MKKTHVFIGILASLLLVAIIIVALLPGMVSSNMMKPFVLQQINQRLPGQLQLEAWSFGWFSGIEGKGIIYDNRQDDLLVKVAGFRTGKGLFGLITDMDNLGTVEITEPAVYVYLAEKTTDQKPDTPAPEPEPKGTPEETGKMALPAFYGQLLISGGSIYTVQEEPGRKNGRPRSQSRAGCLRTKKSSNIPFFNRFRRQKRPSIRRRNVGVLAR